MSSKYRPSVLAVAIPEIFELASDGLNTRMSESVSLKAVADRRGRFLPERCDGVIQWLIYSPNSSSASDKAVLESDDSACGLTLDHLQSVGCSSLRPEFASVKPAGEFSFIHAASASKAIEMLRAFDFDVLVTGDQIPDMSFSQMIARIRSVRPWQKWAVVVGPDNPVQTEIVARSMGASAVFDAPANLDLISELASAIAIRKPVATAVGYASGNLPDRSSARPERPRKSVSKLAKGR